MMPDAGSRWASVSERVYEALLAAYPKEFREEYGPRMTQVFGDICREERRRGGAFGLARLWVRTILDLATTAFVERSSGHVDSKEEVVRNYKLAGIGFVLLLAPLYFVSASLLKYGLGIGFLFDPLEAFLSVSQRRDVFNLVSPVVFLGGLALALALNAFAVLGLDISREDGAVVGTIRLETKFLNIAVVAVSFLLLATLAGYVILENFTYR